MARLFRENKVSSSRTQHCTANVIQTQDLLVTNTAFYQSSLVLYSISSLRFPCALDSYQDNYGNESAKAK